MRYIVGALLGMGAGAGILWGIPGTSVYGLQASAYSTMIIYPAAVLATVIVFLIVVAVMDSGTGH